MSGEIVVSKLPEKVKTNETEYILVKRNEKVLMYKSLHGYEVFKNKVVQKMSKEVCEKRGWKFKESEFTHKEMYPKSEEFGLRAWYTPVFSRAEQIYESIEHL